MRFWDYGSSSDDDAVLDQLPPTVANAIEAERRRQWRIANDTRSEAEKKRAAAEHSRLAYVRWSPRQDDSREILLLLGKSRWGSLSFDLCRRCRRGHVWELYVRPGLQDEGLELQMLRMARTKARDGHRWTRSGFASMAENRWAQIPPELIPEPEKPCEHLRQRPGRVRRWWAPMRYWRITGEFHWPAPREGRVDRLLTAAAERYLAKRRPTDQE